MQEIVLTQPQPADRNPAAVYLARLTSNGSRRVMAAALNNIAYLFGVPMDRIDWAQLRYQHTQYIRAALMTSYAPTTVNRHLSALRGVLKEAWRLGQMDAEAYRHATDVTNIREERLPAGRYVPREEIARLLATCKHDGVNGVRDLALIAILCATGLRRSELVALDLADYDPESARLEVHAGKGRKARIVYLDAGTRTVLGHWLALRGDRPGALFTSTDQHMARLTDNAVYMLLRRRAQRADLPHFTPHDLRRTFVSDLLDHGVDIAVVARLVGHQHIQTTARYDRRGEEALKQAAQAVDLPLPIDDD